MTSLLLLVTACAATPEVEAPYDLGEPLPQPVDPLDEHNWLLQLVGEWEAVSEAVVAPDATPMRWESTESIRAIGDLWVLAEGRSTVGTPFTSILTLGYDPEDAEFKGCWVDSLQTRMWTYRGRLDLENNILTLETEGPSLTDPNATMQYRDQLRLLSPDQKQLISTALGENGEWSTYLTVDFRRKK